MKIDLNSSDYDIGIAVGMERAARECQVRRDLLLGQNVVTPMDAEVAVYNICIDAIRAAKVTP